MSGEATFGAWLRERRRSIDLTQEELADRIGCSPETIRKIETGRRRPSRQIAELLAAVMKVAPASQGALVEFARTGYTADPISYEGGQGPRPLPGVSSSLPLSPTGFIGRAREIADISRLLEAQTTKLLTLVGPPGVGKTRLAIQVGKSSLDNYPDGVFFVSLGPVTDPQLVIPAIATTLGLRETAGQDVRTVLEGYLRDKQLLLILDNFEQLADGAPGLTSLLSGARHLQIVVTSREKLRLSAEQIYPVDPLELPDQQNLPPIEQLERYEAVALFLQQARRVRPDFTLNEQNAPYIAEICYKLDGLALAIELAAARMQVLTPSALLDMLVERLAILTRGAKDLPPRQQTLRNAIAWSYDALGEEERRLFRRMAVFSGGCTLEAAREVCFANGPVSDLLDLVTTLADKSLVRQYEEHGGKIRIYMLQTISEYAGEELALSGEEEALRNRHSAYFMALAETAEPQLMSANRDVWIDRLAMEVANLQTALGWCQSQRGNAEVGLRLAAALRWFWYFRGQTGIGRKWLELQLAKNERAGSEAAAPMLARALYTAGALALISGTSEEAADLLEKSVSLAKAGEDKPTLGYALVELGVARAGLREVDATATCKEGLELLKTSGDRWGTAWARNRLAGIEAWENEEQAKQGFMESLTLYSQLGDNWGIELAVENLGRIALKNGDYADARDKLQRALRLAEAAGDKWSVASTLFSLANAAQLSGDFGEAAGFYAQSIDLFRDFGDLSRVSALNRFLGHNALEQEQYAVAARYYNESLSLALQTGDNQMVVPALMGAGFLAAALNKLKPAASILGAMPVLYNTTGTRPMWVVERKLFEGFLSSLKWRFGVDAFEEEWQSGKTMSMGHVLMLAQQVIYAAGNDADSHAV